MTTLNHSEGNQKNICKTIRIYPDMEHHERNSNRGNSLCLVGHGGIGLLEGNNIEKSREHSQLFCLILWNEN